MAICNSTLQDARIEETPLSIGITFHQLGLLISAIFGLISVLVSLYLIWRHATHYLVPGEQKHIIRILFMVPVYSIVSFLSYAYYRHAVYFDVLRDCYEAFAISSFFALLCHYCAPTLHDQKEYFRRVVPQNWFWGVFGLQKCTGGEDKGILRRPRSGLTWFNVIWVGIFQYCFIRVFFTIVSVITESFDKYCEASLSPAFAHIWVLAFEALSVTFAMFFVIQFYIQLKTNIAEHKPFLKVVSIKLVIFFSFWQTIVISLLSSAKVGVLKPTDKMAYSDIQIGIPSVLLCIEMAIFACLHIFAYPWKPYSLKHNARFSTTPTYDGEISRYSGGFMGWKAILDAFNPWDIVTASARGFRWLFVGSRKRHNDPSYYMPANKLGESVEYNSASSGPVFAGTGEAATELYLPGNNRQNNHERLYGQSGQTMTHEENDSTGLLGGAQAPARTHAAYPSQPTGLDFKPSSIWQDEDTGYHPVVGSTYPHQNHPPPPHGGGISAQEQSVHPAYRGQSPQPPSSQHDYDHQQEGERWNSYDGGSYR